MGWLLGVDVGTTSTKAVLFDRSGNERARASSPPYPNFTPHAGWVEQDPERLWRALIDLLRAIVTQLPSDVRPEAICMAVQSGSLLPADADGVPVYPLITWLDGRSADLVARWRRQGRQPQVKQRSGWSIYTGLPLPTIASLRRNQPDIFAASAHFFSLNDFLAFRLTGRRVTNPSNAGGMQLLNIHSGKWDSTLCRMAGISPQQLSTIEPTGGIIGELLPAICAETGLSPGTLLVNGGHDQVCTALGLDIITPGRFLLACGTAWVLTGVATAVAVESVPTLDWNFHALPQRWTISQSLGGLGATLEWWINQAWTGIEKKYRRESLFAALDAELLAMRQVAGSADGDLFFLPFTGGHRDPGTTESGGFHGLQLGHTRADMARAIMESAGFELNWALQPLLSAGVPLERLWMVGGAAQSDHWPQILADILNVPIQLPRYDFWPALGAALIAGMGTGLFDSYADGRDLFRKPAAEILPRKEQHRRFMELFLHYQSLRS